MELDFRFYCIASVLVLLSIASILTLNTILISISLVAAAFLVPFYKLYYIVEAVIFKRSNFIQVIDGYELGGERAAAIRKLGNLFCATSAAYLHIVSNERLDREKIENIISNSNSPFRFVVHVERIDINKLLDNLSTKRSIKEIELGRLANYGAKANIQKMNTIKRELDVIEQEIERIGTGGSPLKVSQYIMTSALSENRFAAQERAKSQIRELASEFGALLGSRSEIVSGDDLLQLLKFDSFVMS